MNLVLARFRRRALYIQENVVPFLTGTVGRASSRVAEALKGTVVEKAGLFLKNVGVDYREVAVETLEAAKRKPRKAASYVVVGGLLTFCAALNPDAAAFRDAAVSYQLKIMLVDESVRNPESVMKLKDIESWYNEGRLRFFNAGVISFAWLHDYDKESALYPSQCEFLSPTWQSYPSRTVDIGFLGKWWILEHYMVDYDVNEEEFIPKQ